MKKTETPLGGNGSGPLFPNWPRTIYLNSYAELFLAAVRVKADLCWVVTNHQQPCDTLNHATRSPRETLEADAAIYKFGHE